MRCPSGVPLSATLSLLLLAIGVWADDADGCASDAGNPSGGRMVSCVDSCDACATGLRPGDQVLASEFQDCNSCGGVIWEVECAVDRPPAVKFKVKFTVRAGAVEHVSGPYAMLADCGRNLLLVERVETEGDGSGEAVAWRVIVAERIDSDEGEFVASLPCAAEGDAEFDPLGPGVAPSANQTVSCTAEFK